MKKTGFISLLCLLTVAASCGVARVGDAAPVIIDIVNACRLPVEEVKGIIKVSPPVFHVERRDDPDWGHEEDWDLTDKAELARLGLKGIGISIEQGVFRAIYLAPTGAKGGLAHNLGYAGLKPDALMRHDFKSDTWHTAVDKNGLPISIRDDGTWFECFEHRPGH
ncbi:MAG: hypothetical protein HY894_02955 [Deltaproteobacteria bacterium]|nr:hypothetical protein [Deltaproteobacteria bacterium]